MFQMIFLWTLLILSGALLTDGHFHESLIPKGWGEIEKLTVPEGQFRADDSVTINDEFGTIQTTTPEVPTGQKAEFLQFVWKVYNFSVTCTKQELIFSPRFYITEPGYRLQLLLVTNTTYSDMVSYLGVFFRIVAGDYDAELEWPYKHRTMLDVLEHGQLELWKDKAQLGVTKEIHGQYNHTVVPNIDECRLRSAFLRPNSDIETGANTDGCGNRRHIPLSKLESDRYMQDDTLLVMVTVFLNSEPSSINYFRQATMSMRYNELVSNYVWNISDFKQKQKETVSSNQIAILTSNPFYTHSNGYLIQLFLTILPKRNAFAISTAFVQGDHDRYLQWPFPYAFEMAIVDQSPDYWKRDLTVKVKPSKSDCGTDSFAQPGPQPEFCFLTIQSLQVLSLTHYNFLVNDTLRIRFTTRFERYSSRQHSSIVMHNDRLVSEFNWLIPGIMARFERYMQENQRSEQNVTTRALNKRMHKFVSDEFYTNGQGYLCQLVLTVSIVNVPLNFNQTESSLQNVTEASQTQDVMMFGLELVLIEGEYDRFLEWPFNNLYELSIVGYKSIDSDAKDADNENSGGQLYSFDQPPTGATQNHSTNSHYLITPTALVNSGKCSKESFQKPIEKNPPCGVKEFMQMNMFKKQRDSKSSDLTETTITRTIELGTIGKSEEDLHLRVRIYL